MLSYHLMFYKIRNAFTTNKSFLNLNKSIDSFKIKLCGKDEEKKEHEFGQLTATYIDLTQIKEKFLSAIDFKVATNYMKTYPNDISKVVIIEKFQIDKAYRNKGFENEFFKRIILFFDITENIDKVILSPLPYELNDKPYVLKGNKLNNLTEKYYKEHLLKETEKLEDFYKKFGFKSVNILLDNQEKIMVLDTYKNVGKIKEPIKLLFEEKKDGQLFYTFICYKDKNKEEKYLTLNKEKCKKYFPKEFNL